MNIWYQRGIDAANLEEFIEGRQSVSSERQIVGDRFGFLLHRHPKKSQDFSRGYFDGLKKQQEAKSANSCFIRKV
jgi:hypothetical protein